MSFLLPLAFRRLKKRECRQQYGSPSTERPPRCATPPPETTQEEGLEQPCDLIRGVLGGAPTRFSQVCTIPHCLKTLIFRLSGVQKGKNFPFFCRQTTQRPRKMFRSNVRQVLQYAGAAPLGAVARAWILRGLGVSFTCWRVRVTFVEKVSNE